MGQAGESLQRAELVLLGLDEYSENMSIIIPAGYTNVAYRFTLTGDLEQMMVAMGVSNGTSFDVEQVAAEAHTIASAAGNPFAPDSMLSGWRFVGTTATRGTSEDPLVAEYNEVVDGTIAAAPLPNNCAHLVSKRTNLGGRQHRGRMYPPAFHLGESSITPNGTFVENLNTIQALYTSWWGDLVAGDLTPVLFHSAIGVTPTVVTSLILDSRIATQRRRLR